MYQQHELEATLSKEEIQKTLLAGGLPEKSEYTEEEADRFRECRHLIDQGKSYEEVTLLLRQNEITATAEPQLTKPVPQPKAKKSKNAQEPVDKPLNISELLSLASDRGTRISLKLAAQILEACGLPDKEQYTKEECASFLMVAAHFGEQLEGTDTDIESDIDEAAAVLDESGNGVVSEVMRHKAKADASVAASLYLKHLANEFGSPEFQQAWHQMEEMLKAKVVGKSQMRSRQMLGEVRVIPLSPSPSNALPAISDNGSTTD